MRAARVGSCCISVGLKPTNVGPAVIYEISIGKHYLNGPFSGPTALVTGMQAVTANLTRDQMADFLLTMNELWPAPLEHDFQQKLSSMLAELGR